MGGGSHMESNKVVKLLVKVSEIASNITCWGAFYQPKVPKQKYY